MNTKNNIEPKFQKKDKLMGDGTEKKEWSKIYLSL
jgi:hypothetical protein